MRGESGAARREEGRELNSCVAACEEGKGVQTRCFCTRVLLRGNARDAAGMSFARRRYRALVRITLVRSCKRQTKQSPSAAGVVCPFAVCCGLRSAYRRKMTSKAPGAVGEVAGGLFEQGGGGEGDLDRESVPSLEERRASDTTVASG